MVRDVWAGLSHKEKEKRNLREVTAISFFIFFLSPAQSLYLFVGAGLERNKNEPFPPFGGDVLSVSVRHQM